MRGHPADLMIDAEINTCYLLKWKTQRKVQRKGRGLDPKHFHEEEQKVFRESIAKERTSFTDT